MYKKKVAILGGAFDPITNGHIEVCLHVLNTLNIDEVWLMPSYKNTDKQMIEPFHRIEMCKKAALVDNRIRICTYEIDNQLDGGTNKILESLKQESEHEHIDFSMIIGMDQANNLKNWINSDELKENISFIVLSREGYDKKTNINWYLKEPHIYLENSLEKISSTEVRFAVRCFYNSTISNQHEYLERLKKFLDKKVILYIIENDLYK